jgi:hypothetical protein
MGKMIPSVKNAMEEVEEVEAFPLFLSLGFLRS